MFKKILVGILAIPFIYLIVVISAFYSVYFFKVTDPNHPSFEPKKFELIDVYWINSWSTEKSHVRKKVETLLKLFPAGIHISEVDEEMVNKRGCHSWDTSKYLKYPPYDKQTKIKKSTAYSCPLEWWSPAFYFVVYDSLPRLGIEVNFDENDNVIRNH